MRQWREHGAWWTRRISRCVDTRKHARSTNSGVRSKGLSAGRCSGTSTSTIPASVVVVALARGPGLAADAGTMGVTQYRIDETHSNAYSVWKKHGSPSAPNWKLCSTLPSGSFTVSNTAHS